jgi:transcriptional regulator with XRE-family HTH domain
MWQLLAARLALGITQDELAQLVGVSRVSINMFENKKNKSKELKKRIVDELEANGIHFINTTDEVGISLRSDEVDEPEEDNQSKEDDRTSNKK